MRWTLDNETIHNWTARYADCRYYADLPAVVAYAITVAHQRHINGEDASDLARELADAHGCFILPSYLLRP